jgi:hypothetical protein
VSVANCTQNENQQWQLGAPQHETEITDEENQPLLALNGDTALHFCFYYQKRGNHSTPTPTRSNIKYACVSLPIYLSTLYANPLQPLANIL